MTTRQPRERDSPTPGLNGVMDLAKSNTPVLGYTVSYAISNVLLTFLGPVIVFTV